MRITATIAKFANFVNLDTWVVTAQISVTCDGGSSPFTVCVGGGGGRRREGCKSIMHISEPPERSTLQMTRVIINTEVYDIIRSSSVQHRSTER